VLLYPLEHHSLIKELDVKIAMVDVLLTGVPRKHVISDKSLLQETILQK